jgi:predicted NACHT family NTPase
MSEGYTPPATVETESPDAGDDLENPETEREEHEDEGDDPPERKPTDWEKQAHDKAGQAAKERSKRRAAERALSELSGRFEALEQRIAGGGRDDLVDLISGLRDDDDEPITDIQQIKKALKTFLARDAAGQEQQLRQSQQSRRVNDISNNMEAFETDFAADHPDYMQAAAHLRQARQEELEDLGYSGNALMSKLANEFYGLAEDAMRSGRDPAEVVYGMAKRRGFQAGKESANAKLQKLQRANGSSPSPGGGASAGAGRSWGSVAKTTGKEFDREFAALRKRELGKK